MKSYCEAGVSMQQVWVEGGLTLCFYFTLVPSVLLTLSFLFGTFVCICYSRYGTDMEPKFIPRSRLYRLQVGLSVLLVLQALGWMVFRIARSGELPGYVVVVDLGRGPAASGEEEGSGAGQNQRTQCSTVAVLGCGVCGRKPGICVMDESSMVVDFGN
ncbi:hypothetical protein M9458_002303, partial [Cirrhinus mrigala]